MLRTRKMKFARVGAGAVAALILSMGLSSATFADVWETPDAIKNEDFPDNLSQFVSPFTGEVSSFEGVIDSVESVEKQGDEQVITLEADILFQRDKWDLPQSSYARIASLLKEVPQDAKLAVHGHTDSVQGAVDNLELSENRAQAVADAIAEVRSDLVLDVAGFGATQLKEKESGDNIEKARQTNRRVELRYEG